MDEMKIKRYIEREIARYVKENKTALASINLQSKSRPGYLWAEDQFAEVEARRQAISALCSVMEFIEEG